MSKTLIKNRVKSIIKKANNIWDLNLPLPNIIFFNNDPKWIGYAEPYKNTVAYNMDAFNQNPYEFRYVIIHEVSHLIQFHIFPRTKYYHGKEFYVIDRALGGLGKATYNI